MNDALLDVVILGAGTAGLAALRDVQKRTDSFVIIDGGGWGTTCARVGCMPSKALIEAANAYHRRHALDAFGVRGAGALRVDLPAVLARVRELRDGFVAGVRRATEGLGDRAIDGHGAIVAPGCVEVGGRRLHTRAIIVATGSRPFVPAPWRALDDRLLTSDTLFEQLDLPRRIAVVGMGPIGVELAQALCRLGVEVVGFDASERVAALGDPAVNAELLGALREEFPVHVGSPAEVSLDEDGSVRVANASVEARVDAVLVALGRRSDLASVGLGALGVELDERGLPRVDPATTRVEDLPVFLAGDANGELALLHEAADEGHIAALMATDAEAGPFERRVPLSIVFCDPNVAVVGRRLSELDASDVLIGEYSFRRQGRARIAQRASGVLRVYAARETGLLLGAELCAPSGEHLAHLLALAIGRRLTVHDLLRMPFYHPVLEEGLRTALRSLAAQLPPCGVSDLAGCGAIGAEGLE